MKWLLAAILLLSVIGSVAWAQQPGRLWYRGPFEGWVDIKDNPGYGYYYQPSESAAYPLNEAAYGRPIPCEGCGHTHRPGAARCGFRGCDCDRAPARVDPNTVYSPRPLPGMYFYKEQPHYRFQAPMRGGWLYQKYTRPFD